MCHWTGSTETVNLTLLGCITRPVPSKQNTKHRRAMFQVGFQPITQVFKQLTGHAQGCKMIMTGRTDFHSTNCSLANVLQAVHSVHVWMLRI
jgi:hypothetical protein